MWWEWAFSRNFGHSVGEEEVEIMTVDWAALPNFFYLKTVIKLHWQNWPKTKHFPYLWPPAGEGDQAFLRHLSRLKTEPAAAQMSFSPASKKILSMCQHLVILWARVMVMALYGRMHFAQHICCIQTFFLNTAQTWHGDTCTKPFWGLMWLLLLILVALAALYLHRRLIPSFMVLDSASEFWPNQTRSYQTQFRPPSIRLCEAKRCYQNKQHRVAHLPQCTSGPNKISAASPLLTQTWQELRMLSSVTLYCQATVIDMTWGELCWVAWNSWSVNLSRTWGYTSELMRAKWEAGLCECLARLIQGAREYGDVWVDIRQQFVGMASAGHTGESDSWLSCHPRMGPAWRSTGASPKVWG